MQKKIPRRNFLKNAGIFTSGLALARFPLSGKQLPANPLHNIPVNKGIDAAWLKSLYERGPVSNYLKSRNELKYIGMPAGGLHAGTVYVGGDGRLWLWQIYNETMEPGHEGIDPKTAPWNDGSSLRNIRPRDGAAYVAPAIADNLRVLEQGFAIRVQQEGRTWVKELQEAHWEEIAFEPAYPVALVRYSSKDCPVEVQLKVYTPFIPLDAENSSLPATILRVGIKNISGAPLEVTLLGWLENGANKLTAKPGNGKKRCRAVNGNGYTALFFDYDTSDPALQIAPDAGTMCLTLHRPAAGVNTALAPWPVTAASFDPQKTTGTASGQRTLTDAAAIAPDKLVGGITTAGRLEPGASLHADYSIAWHFNHPHPKLQQLVKDAEGGYFYGARFKDALAVSKYLAAHFQQLTAGTELWERTWNDSTLPHWFLERTFVNIGTLATANTYRFASGRFWAWEGVGACAGTCTHVWQYAQSMARIFPGLEKDLRERVDLGVGFRADGAIIFRAENESRPAIDGQAGTILRFYREHQMSSDDAFLRRNWPQIKKAVQFMLAQDRNGDGLTDTPMENTLDAVWEGEIAWIAGLCVAAARAAQAMAEEMNDRSFAAVCAAYVAKGSRNMESQLFNGEYFIHQPAPVAGRKKLGSYNTCHIDQVYGQSWAFQVGLPRVLDREKTLSALKALWKYNFTMDVGPYIKTHTGGRPYALAGEGGMIMNTNCRNEPRPYGEDVTWQLGYFHECMSGFEHQVAAHLMAEGMVDESLVLTRVIHERYHPSKRNPFNEIECSDHYARAMASYGTFISACGFAYHGPKGFIAFAPRIRPEDFKCAFTAAEGWGSYRQKKDTKGQQHAIEPAFGVVKLKTLRFAIMDGAIISRVSVLHNGTGKALRYEQKGEQINIRLKEWAHIKAGEKLTVILG